MNYSNLISEYIFKEELVFYEEKCGPLNPTDDPVLCEEALAFYNVIFIIGIVAAVCMLITLNDWASPQNQLVEIELLWDKKCLFNSLSEKSFEQFWGI